MKITNKILVNTLLCMLLVLLLSACGKEAVSMPQIPDAMVLMQDVQNYIEEVMSADSVITAFAITESNQQDEQLDYTCNVTSGVLGGNGQDATFFLTYILEDNAWNLKECRAEIAETVPEPPMPEAEPVVRNDYNMGDEVTLANADFLRGNEVIYAAIALDDNYCVVYTALDELPEPDDNGFVSLDGEVYCVDIYSGEAKPLYNGLQPGVGGASFRPWYPVQIGDDILFGCTDNFTFLYSTHLWSLTDDGMITYKVTEETGALTYQGNGLFISNVCTDTGYSSLDLTEFIGRIWNDYWMFWDSEADCLREFSGTELSHDELISIAQGDEEIQTVLTALEQENWNLYTVYLRGNGILNINFYKQESDILCHYSATFQYQDGQFTAVDGAVPGENEGMYMPAAFSHLASDAGALELKDHITSKS